MQNPKHKPLRDPAYIKHLHGERCLFTGAIGFSDPMHIGTLGKGIKSPDNEVLPISHTLHAHVGHQFGEISMIRREAPDDVIRLAFRALAREMHRAYQEERDQ